MNILKGMPSDTFVTIPRYTKISVEKEILEGYVYEGMERAIRAYINTYVSSRSCFLLKRRSAEELNKMNDLQIACIDPSRRVGIVTGYDEESQTFKVNISDTEYYSSLIKPVVMISYIADNDHEKRIKHVKRVVGLYL